MKRQIALLTALLSVGCVSASVQRLDNQPRPEQPVDHIQVLVEEPAEPYEVIAVVEAKTGTLFKGRADLQGKLIAEAARLGGDAVIVGKMSTESGVLFTHTSQVQLEEKMMVGTVIVFTGQWERAHRRR